MSNALRAKRKGTTKMKVIETMSFEELSESIRENSYMSKFEADARAIAIRGLVERAREMYVDALNSRRRRPVVNPEGIFANHPL